MTDEGQVHCVPAPPEMWPGKPPWHREDEARARQKVVEVQMMNQQTNHQMNQQKHHQTNQQTNVSQVNRDLSKLAVAWPATASIIKS